MDMVEFVRKRFTFLADEINDLRNQFCMFKELEDDQFEEFMIKESDMFNYGFKTYFEFINFKWLVEQDGGGINKNDRAHKLIKGQLQSQLF